MKKSWRPVDDVVNDDSDLHRGDLVHQPVLPGVDGAGLLHLLGDDPEDEGHPWPSLLLQLLQVPLDRKAAGDGVELEVGCVAAVPRVQDVADGSGQALVAVDSDDLADKVPDLAALRQSRHGRGR